MRAFIKFLASKPEFNARSGQAMVEYVVIAGTLLASFAIFYLFEGTFKEFGTRVLNLIGSEYP